MKLKISKEEEICYKLVTFVTTSFVVFVDWALVIVITNNATPKV